MYQQSDSVNACPDASRTLAEEATDVDVDLDAAIFSDMSLPAFLGRYIGDGAGNIESVDALGMGLVERVLGAESDSAGGGNHRLSAEDDRRARADAAVRIAHFLRIVGSVASREVTLDASHRPPAGGPEYDPRRLLVAAYNVLSDAACVAGDKRFSKSRFGRLAAGIQNNVFSNWTKQFERHQSDVRDFWSQLGLCDGNDARATIDRLEMLRNADAPEPTLEDLIASPFYRKLLIIQRSSVSDAQRRAVHSRLARLSDETTSSEDARPMRASGMIPLPPIAASTARSGGGGGDARVDVAGSAGIYGVDAAVLPFLSAVPRNPTMQAANTASRMAHFLRILGSVARRDVIPDESHRPPLGASEYDARGLLVTAYNALSQRGHPIGAKRLSKSTFSRLAVGIHTNRFSDWTRQFANHLSASARFWAQHGFGDWRDAQATIDELEALYEAGAPPPTVQDLVDSPFYRQLSFIKQSGVTDAERSKKRVRLARPADHGSARAACDAMRASQAEMPSNAAMTGQRAGGVNEACWDAGAWAGFGPIDRTYSPVGLARPGPASATATRGNTAERIADLLRILGSVANREIRFDESHRPPADGPVYDARCLLVAAYNILHRKGHASGSHRLSKRHFNRLVVKINSGLFNLWTLQLGPYLRGAVGFWAHFGLDDSIDAQVTIERLEALQRAAMPPPMVQDLVDSPLHRKLAFNGQNRIGSESLKRTKRSTGANLATTAAFDLMIDESMEAVPWSQVPVSFDALGASTQSRPDPVAPIQAASASDRRSRRCVANRSPRDAACNASPCSLRTVLFTPPPPSSASPNGHIWRSG